MTSLCIAFNMFTGLSSMTMLYLAYRKIKKSTVALHQLPSEIEKTQETLADDIAGKVSKKVLQEVSQQLGSIFKWQDHGAGVATTMGTTADIRLIPPPATFNNGPLHLDQNISVLGLSDRLRERLPSDFTIMDLFSKSTASLKLSLNLAHELNQTLVSYALDMFVDMDGFTDILGTHLTAYGLANQVDGVKLETVGDAIRHPWHDSNSERHYVGVFRRAFSKFILDYSVHGFEEVCKRKVVSFQLTVRVTNLLHANGIRTVEDLISRTVSSLRRNKNFGKVAIHEIRRKVLIPKGLQFAMLDEPLQPAT